ncbi:MAG: S41 family peptidase [Candidatus Pacebacteria bacterium]|nr:S41 family peptidase [Candidatus Paceibacterota bacterium]
MNLKRKIVFIAGSVILIAGFFVLGVYIGYEHRPSVSKIGGISNKENPKVDADFEPFWKVWNLIDEKYADSESISAEDRVHGAIKGLVDSLNDPYSVYFPPEESKEFDETIKGSFEGIGMEVGMKDKILTIISPLKNTPADNAGLRAGDKILGINETSTSDISVDKAVSLIRGEKGTPVKLTIYREGEKKAREISVVRDVIKIPTLKTEARKDGVFVVELYNFSQSSANLFGNALIDFKNSGLSNLVIDLRGNPGGFLEASVDIASMFLPTGDLIVSEGNENEDAKSEVFRSRGYGIIDPSKYKIVILIDRGSASASEIVAGALREHNVAKLIGETTYGKGSVQELIDITKDTTLKITVAKWYTPNGVSISTTGIEPDIKIKPTEKDIEAKRDPAMERAILYFNTGK